MGERADGVEHHIAPELQPDLRAKVGRDRRLEAGASQGFGELLDAFRSGPVRFAQGEAVALGHLDHARRHQFAGRIDHRADDPLVLDVGGYDPVRIRRAHRATFVRAGELVEIPPGDAVLQRHHTGVRTQQPAEGGRHSADLVRLDRQQHRVLGTALVDGAGPGVLGDLLAPVLLDQPEALAADGGEVGSPGDEGHVLSGQGKPRAQKASDGARADHRQLHRVPLPPQDFGSAAIRSIPATKVSIGPLRHRREARYGILVFTCAGRPQLDATKPGRKPLSRRPRRFTRP